MKKKWSKHNYFYSMYIIIDMKGSTQNYSYCIFQRAYECEVINQMHMNSFALTSLNRASNPLVLLSVFFFENGSVWGFLNSQFYKKQNLFIPGSWSGASACNKLVNFSEYWTDFFSNNPSNWTGLNRCYRYQRRK